MWNASKLAAPAEIAHGTLRLPAPERQGEARWVACLALTPAPRVKGPVWGGEIRLELHYAEKVRFCTSSCL